MLVKDWFARPDGLRGSLPDGVRAQQRHAV